MKAWEILKGIEEGKYTHKQEFASEAWKVMVDSDNALWDMDDEEDVVISSDFMSCEWHEVIRSYTFIEAYTDCLKNKNSYKNDDIEIYNNSGSVFIDYEFGNICGELKTDGWIKR